MSAPKNLQEFKEKFIDICNMGWIETHRRGRTGIGKTLEDLLEIEENNVDGPDFGIYELKSMRTNGGDLQLLTLLTKSPEPDGINSYLRETYGYISDNYEYSKKVLHSTLDAAHFTQIADTGKALKVNCTRDRVEIIDNDGNVPAYWTKDVLKRAFEKKYPYSMVHVYADSRMGRREEFLYHTAYELSDFSFEKMNILLQDGKIKVDIRIGQYPDGKTHDHGTGFRIQDRSLTEIFLNKQVIYDRP